MAKRLLIWLAWGMLAGLLAACRAPAPIIVVPPATLEPTPVITPAPVRVYVSGAVVSPGVYRLPPGSIGQDALLAAGGALLEADLERVNLALEVHDQAHFHVPRRGEAPASPLPQTSPVAGAPAADVLARININTASAEMLERLPKIGPSMAQQIVAYRTQNGPFQRIEDIMNVSGIGQATFDQIKDLISVAD